MITFLVLCLKNNFQQYISDLFVPFLVVVHCEGMTKLNMVLRYYTIPITATFTSIINYELYTYFDSTALMILSHSTLSHQPYCCRPMPFCF